MKKVIMMLLAAMLVPAGTAFAITGEEYKTVQRIADEYMSNVPSDGYHLSAEDILNVIV